MDVSGVHCPSGATILESSEETPAEGGGTGRVEAAGGTNVAAEAAAEAGNVDRGGIHKTKTRVNPSLYELSFRLYSLNHRLYVIDY